MKKNSAIMRVFRLDLSNFLYYSPQFLLIMLAFGLVWFVSDTVSPIYVVMIFIGVIPMNFTLQRYTTYFPQTVGYGATRTSLVLGGLPMKGVYATFAASLTLFAWLLDGREPLAVTVGFAVLLALLGGALGDIIGILMVKIGQEGLFLYFVFQSMFFITVGGVYGTKAVENLDTAILVPFAIAVAILTLGGTLLVHLLLKRIEVR